MSELMLEVHLEPVLEEIEKAGLTALECPRCHQETLVLAVPIRCRFCGFESEDGEARAVEFITNVLGVDRYRVIKDGDEWPQFDCLECEAPALVEMESFYACFQCAATWDRSGLTTCGTCGSLMGRDDETNMCSDCWRAILSRDD